MTMLHHSFTFPSALLLAFLSTSASETLPGPPPKPLDENGLLKLGEGDYEVDGTRAHTCADTFDAAQRCNEYTGADRRQKCLQRLCDAFALKTLYAAYLSKLAETGMDVIVFRPNGPEDGHNKWRRWVHVRFERVADDQVHIVQGNKRNHPILATVKSDGTCAIDFGKQPTPPDVDFDQPQRFDDDDEGKKGSKEDKSKEKDEKKKDKSEKEEGKSEEKKAGKKD